MILIFRISASIIISLFLWQIFWMEVTLDEGEVVQVELRELQTLKNKVIMLNNEIHRYYQKNTILPQYISDLSCKNVLEGGIEEIPCASKEKDGEFYVNDQENWVSIYPYVIGSKVENLCATSLPLNVVHGIKTPDDAFDHCTELGSAVNFISDYP